MYEIFKELIDRKELKAADVCRGTGLPSSFFSEWKRGKSKPKYDKLKLIADFLGVTPEYLMTGHDETSLPPAFDLDAAIDQQYGADVTDHVHKYVSLDMEDRSRIDERTETLLEGEKYSAKEGSSAGMAG